MSSLHAGICSLHAILQALERLPAVAHLWAYCDFSLEERERAIIGFFACLSSLQFFGPGHGHVPELSPFALNKNCATVFDNLVSQTSSVEQLRQKMDK
jgi:hypothetical protein